MLNKVYKYHLLLYSIYKHFGGRIFYGRQAEEAKCEENIVDTTSLRMSKLISKRLIKWATREEVEAQIKNPDYRRLYRRISEEGLRICKYLDDNPKLITKHLLKS
jgi:hypothetical protein